MRRLILCAFGALVLAGLTLTTVTAADEDADGSDSGSAAKPEKKSGNWLTRWIDYHQKASAKQSFPARAADKSTAKAVPKKETAVDKPTPAVDKAAAQRDREQAAFVRRADVCDKLKQIALQTNDSELMQQAEELDERAWTLYSQKMGQLPSRGAKEPDEQILEKRARAGNTSGRQEVSPTHAVDGKIYNSSAAMEGRP